MLERINNTKWLKKFELSEFPEPEIVDLNHPVLICHGFGAIASLIKPSPLYDVAMLMRAHNVLAFAPNIVPYADIETRAESWVQVIEKLMEKIQADKINVIAHSMGGLDMRYALANYDIKENVASFTTVCTPHRGTSLAEASLKTPDVVRERLGDFLDWMGDHMYPHTKSDVLTSAAQLTRRHVLEVFNPKVPDVAGIPYYSYSSAVGKATSHPIKMFTRYQNNLIYDKEGPNDGMVSVESAKWGEHMGTGNLSHMEQINLGLKDERQDLFEAFWMDITKMLAQKGH